MSIAGHRWQYDYDLCRSRCVKLPFGGVESYQWCIGCGCEIDDRELVARRLPRKGVYLDTLAYEKGYKPIQAGTLSEFDFKYGIKR